MNRIWVGAGTAFILIAASSAVLWLAAGQVWALAAANLGLLLLGLHHVRSLARLWNWLREPDTRELPEGRGAWDDVFSALYRQHRLVTRQRQDLADALERFRKAWQALPNGVVILDTVDHIEWVNATAEEHLGLDAQRDRGYPITNLIRQPDFVAYLKNTQTGESGVLRVGRNKGQLLSVSIVRFGDGQRLVMTRDITRWERLETMRRDFVANVSHELKTPLTVVSGFVEMLEEHWSDLTDDERAHYLSLANEQAGRMRRLIEDLLTLSALEAEDTQAPSEPIEVQPLLDVLVREAEALSHGRHRILRECNGPEYLLGAEREILSALSNLVSNAVRYSPEGGRVTLRWIGDGSGASFSVEDTGLGIEARHIPRLTERFYRVDRGRSRETGGTGLGLAIVKHVSSRHQAKLDIVSEPGKGSTFFIQFPAHRVGRAQAAA